MKTLLILSVLFYFLSVPLYTQAQAFKGTDYPTLSRVCYAVFIIDYPDTKSEIRSKYPSADELRKEIFDSTRFIQQYLKTMSYGKFTFSGDVFGPFTHQDSVTSKNNYQMDSYATINSLSIPGFQYSKYTHFAFISYNDWNPGGGCSYSNTGKTILINNVKYTLPAFFRMVLAIGPYNRNPAYAFSNQYTEKFMSQIFVPVTELPGGEYFFENYSGMTVFQRVFLHELFHTLGVWTHANSSTNGNKYVYETEVPDNKDFLRYVYGNKMDMTGDGQWGMSLNGGYRDMLGWTDADNRIKIEGFGRQKVRLYPLNNKTGKRICEIRIPYKYYVKDPEDIYNYPADGRKNQGYFLEVRTADRWDSTLNHPAIKYNTDGILVMKTDGWTTALLDASPSANLKYDWGSVPDLRDVAVKPGMRYWDSRLYLSGVEEFPDGSFSADVEVIDPSGFPYKVTLFAYYTVPIVSGNVTLTWKRSLYAEKYFLQIAKDPSFSVVIKNDSTRLDTLCIIPGLENNTNYYWRVRGKNITGNGPWSDTGNFTTSLTGINGQLSGIRGAELFQNFPNPFRESTIISYSVFSTGHVKLTISDITGKEITVPVNQVQVPGVYEVLFNPNTVCGGIFFCKLEAGDYRLVRKMICLK